ncbi:MAG: carboxypeptidase-like regulatory domain-containing protein [Bacteroidia bacterium]
MQNRDTNRLNMIRTTIQWCNENPAATSAIPAFAGIKATVETKLTIIDQLNQTATKGSKGVTIDTNISRLNMQKIAFKCACALTAYAATIKSNTLRAKVNYTLNQMSAKKKEEIDDICQTIHDEANLNLASATGFGYTLTDVTDLQTAINLYRDSMANPRQAIISRSVALQTIKTQIREILNTLLKQQMDSMVHTLIISNPTFVSSYFNARKIIDLGTTHTRVAGIITNKNGTPIQNATFTAHKTGEPVEATLLVAQIKTDNRGRYSIPKFPPGDYTFQWQHPNYQPRTETNIHIRPGKEHKRKITLIPL